MRILLFVYSIATLYACRCNVTAADTTDITDDADSDLDMPDDLLDPSDDEDRKRDISSATADDKVHCSYCIASSIVENDFICIRDW